VYGLQTLRKLYVLLVDSDQAACVKLQQALDDHFMLRSTSTIAEAKRYMAEGLPDVLICEVHVGQEDGLDLCRYIRSIPSFYFLPIMLLTSLATLQDKVAGFEAGADDYVIKPFDARHLAARIRMLSRIKRIEESEA
jgi:DNA-binding response OmpR family regulator